MSRDAKVIEHPAARAARLEAERDELADALLLLCERIDAEHGASSELRAAAARYRGVLTRWGHR